MTRTDFDRLLSWTMLSALHGAVLERQTFLGRNLTEAEYTECHKATHQNAERICQELQLARAMLRT
jgi:hypothetical protein